MGIDYDAMFGFGVEIDEATFEGIDDKEEYLSNILEGTDYRYFWYGDVYSDQTSYCIALRENIFDVDYNANMEVEEFESFLREKGIKFKGKTNIIGGLYIS